MSRIMPRRSYNNSARPHLAIHAHDKVIRRLVYLQDGRHVVTGSDDGAVRIWNVENGEQHGSSMEHNSEISGLAVTREGAKIVSGADNGSIKIWEVEPHEIVHEWTHPENYPIVAISPDDRLVAVGGRKVFLYSMDGMQLVNHSIDVGRTVWSMSFSPASDKLACGTDDDIRVYEVASGTLLLGPLESKRDVIGCVLWSLDGNKLFSCSDETIRCWSPNSGEPIGQPWVGHAGSINAISLSPSGSVLASASWDETVCFWDTTSGLPIGQHLRHFEGVTAVCFSPSGESVASGSWDGMMYLWRVSGSDPIENQEGQTIPGSSLSRSTGYKGLQSDSDPLYLSAPARAIALNALSIIHPTPSPAVERASQSSRPSESQPSPDLTPYIVRTDNHYLAGGSFGDIYRCRYVGGLEPKEVAVKAFRFRIAMEGDTDDRSVKMLRRELGIWKRLNHINIVPFLGIAYGFGMSGSMSLVSLWMSNDTLHNFLAKHDDSLGVMHRLQFLLDIANGLHYCKMPYYFSSVQ
ncbi:WD40-repeat-containing domain protein [Boletus reticuloceps]|uniref:WD40-repeat-containing domain protein n=1 Tax=Boletus reticuloceps TaxID=495285 RepID=A0A8I2Z402_9AGAM|nr:WD40-repeat-containing domain protein [Boletus reticuloceps]